MRRLKGESWRFFAKVFCSKGIWAGSLKVWGQGVELVESTHLRVYAQAGLPGCRLGYSVVRLIPASIIGFSVGYLCQV